MNLSTLPKRYRKPLVTKQLIIKVPDGVDPNGVAVDIPAAIKAAKRPTPGDSADFDIRLLIHLMRRQYAKIDPKAVGDPQEFIRQMRFGLNPRDKIEEILAGSILLAYARLAHLSHVAANSPDESDLLPFYKAADRTSNNLRRQLLLLSTHRRCADLPRNPPDNHETSRFVKNKKSTIEKEFSHAPKTLSAHPKGPASPPRRHPKNKTLAIHHRPKNPKR